MRETIGLLGGSFNPIHNGHLAMARAALEKLALDRLLIMPDGDPPHKSSELAPKRHRLRMAELAADGRLEVSAMEVDRPGKTYTVDTLEALRALYPRSQLIMLIGADTLDDLHTWKNAPRVFELCHFAVFSRQGYPFIEVPGATLLPVEAAVPDISATDIRGRVHRGDWLEGYVPQAVEDYIGLHRLYGPPARMGTEAIRRRLKDTLTAGRYRHTLGVAGTMRQLAERWGYDRGKAALCGLLHDCAKALTLQEMNALVDAHGLPVAADRRGSTALLHAPAGAAMARAVYGVTDPDILRAIRYHNTGHPPLGPLDRLLLVADMTEPGRHFPAWQAELDALRALSMEDLDAAVIQVLRQKLAHVQARGATAHPDTAATLAAMELTTE